MKTFMYFLKMQEERQKFSQLESERQFAQKLNDHKNKVLDLLN